MRISLKDKNTIEFVFVGPYRFFQGNDTHDIDIKKISKEDQNALFNSIKGGLLYAVDEEALSFVNSIESAGKKKQEKKVKERLKERKKEDKQKSFDARKAAEDFLKQRTKKLRDLSLKNLKTVTKELEVLTVKELEVLLDLEKKNKCRKSLIKTLNNKIEKHYEEVTNEMKLEFESSPYQEQKMPKGFNDIIEIDEEGDFLVQIEQET